MLPLLRSVAREGAVVGPPGVLSIPPFAAIAAVVLYGLYRLLAPVIQAIWYHWRGR
jgi:hypothetical protein